MLDDDSAKQAIGTAVALPIVWNYPWPKHQKMGIF
jgi:hypothetical protein